MRHQMHIGVNRRLDPTSRRLTLAHESGHFISFHPAMNYTCERNAWFKSKLEHEAQIIAAYLLVPKLAAMCYGQQLTARQLAARLEVPISLVDLRWSQGVISGEL
jgi:Zn-dependent peptidase ImmA (M78 family)